MLAAVLERLPTTVLLLLLVVPVLAGGLYYGMVAMELRRRQGSVSTEYFGFADLLMGSVLAGYFAWNGFSSFHRVIPASEMRMERLLGNMAFMLLMGATVIVFVIGRGIPARTAFGLEFEKLPISFQRAAIGLGTALPPIWAMNLLSHYLLGEQGREQGLVSIFRNAAESGDWSTVRLVALSALVVAPVVEEVIFRGYFFVTLKRYLGPVWAALWASSLFAISHGNLGVCGGLFVLSICLTIAYERFGSLWVSIAMHSCFNALSLVLLFMQGKGWMPN